VGIDLKKYRFGIFAFIIVLLTMPLGHALMVLMEKILGHEAQFTGAFILGDIGVLMLIYAITRSNKTTSTFLGLFAGILVWTGWVEFSFVWVAHKLAIPPLVENGAVVTKPEYLIMPSTLGLFGAIATYYLFSKTNCRFFMWLQKKFKIKEILSDRQNSSKPVAVVVFFEIILVLWMFYLVLLLSYDNTIAGDRHPVTYIVAFGSLFWSLFLFANLIKIQDLSYAIRYAIPVVVIFWNFVEILGRWDFFEEIWIKPMQYKYEISILLLVLIIFTLYSIFSQRKRRAEKN
jgi:hypothetical protein